MTATFQSTVNIWSSLGVVGDMAFDGPMRAGGVWQSSCISQVRGTGWAGIRCESRLHKRTRQQCYSRWKGGLSGLGRQN